MPVLLRNEIISHHFAAFHYEAHALKFRDVTQGNTGDHDDVCVLSNFNRSHVVLSFQKLCRNASV